MHWLQHSPGVLCSISLGSSRKSVVHSCVVRTGMHTGEIEAGAHMFPFQLAYCAMAVTSTAVFERQACAPAELECSAGKCRKARQPCLERHTGLASGVDHAIRHEWPSCQQLLLFRRNLHHTSQSRSISGPQACIRGAIPEWETYGRCGCEVHCSGGRRALCSMSFCLGRSGYQHSVASRP